MNESIFQFQGCAPKIDKSVFVASGSKIIGDVEIGSDSNVWFNTVIRGDVHYIRIGDRTNIQDNSTIHVTTGLYPTLIGNDVTVGHNALLHGCTIADECLVGMGSIIMDQATIGKHSIVAAGALIPQGKTYPEGHLIMGSPAKAVRPLTSEEITGLKQSSQHYVELARSYMSQ